MAGDWQLHGSAGRVVSGDVGAIVDLFIRGRVELSQIAPEIRGAVETQAANRARRELRATSERLRQRATEDAARVQPRRTDRDANAHVKRFES